MTLWWILSARTSKFKSRESYGCRNHYDSTRAPIASLQWLFRLSICSLLLAKCPPEIACHTCVLCVVCCVFGLLARPPLRKEMDCIYAMDDSKLALMLDRIPKKGHRLKVKKALLLDKRPAPPPLKALPASEPEPRMSRIPPTASASTRSPPLPAALL